jgi:crotonobetaine/carnitine-CoA ligase
VPIAFVLTSSDDPAVLEQIESACAQRLADFKRPRAIYRVDTFPRSTLNKVNKVELRAVVEPDADRYAAAKRWLEEAAADPSGDEG